VLPGRRDRAQALEIKRDFDFGGVAEGPPRRLGAI